MQLAEQKCLACEGGVEPVSAEEIARLVRQTPGWKVKARHIERDFRLPDFAQAMDFANQVARIAEEENHHPDLHISWGKVGVRLTTHAVDALTINDFIMAAKINALLD